MIMITGDHPQTARAVARQIGLVQSEQPTIVTGDQLHRMSITQLQLALNHEEVIFARVAADQKMRIVSAFKRKRQIVAVTGDGVNDAPALKRADIGIAMGVTGTDVAREAADMVLTDDNFASIVAAVEEGRAVFDNIRKFLTYVLTSNVPELIPYLSFVLFRIPLALTIIQVLGVDLGTDMLPALALGAEKPAPGVMSRPPRSRKDRLLPWWLLIRVYFCLGLMESVTAMSAFFFVLISAGWHHGQELGRLDPLYLQATTACFAGVVLTQAVNVFLCRSDRASTFSFGLLENPWILWGVGVELLLLLGIVYTPWGHAIFARANPGSGLAVYRAVHGGDAGDRGNPEVGGAAVSFVSVATPIFARRKSVILGPRGRFSGRIVSVYNFPPGRVGGDWPAARLGRDPGPLRPLPWNPSPPSSEPSSRDTRISVRDGIMALLEKGGDRLDDLACRLAIDHRDVIAGHRDVAAVRQRRDGGHRLVTREEGDAPGGPYGPWAFSSSTGCSIFARMAGQSSISIPSIAALIASGRARGWTLRSRFSRRSARK